MKWEKPSLKSLCTTAARGLCQNGSGETADCSVGNTATAGCSRGAANAGGCNRGANPMWRGSGCASGGAPT